MGATIVPLAHPSDLGVAIAPQLADLDGLRQLEPKAYAALDGPMFGSACSPHGRGPGCVQYRLRDRRRDVDLPSIYPDRGLTFAVGGITSSARVLRGADDDEIGSASVAVQTWPTLVDNGDPTSGSADREAVGRAALCVLRDGRLAFAAGTGPMGTFARELVERGVLWAGYTDGGGSTGLLGPGVELGGNRPVPAWLVATPRSWLGRWWPAVLGSAAVLVVSAVVLPRDR
jgi:hypothetical protein